MKTEEAPSEKDWNEWLQHPCTKALREWAKERREDLKEMWANGDFAASFEVEMLVKNAGATGACSIYTHIEELDFNLIIEGVTNAKQVGLAAPRPSGSS